MNVAADEFLNDSDKMYYTYHGSIADTGETTLTVRLPDLENSVKNTQLNYVIVGVELAIFEKKAGESTYAIYKDADGKESKRYYYTVPHEDGRNYADSLTYTIDIGNISDYRCNAIYKIAFRYYVSPIYDMSQTVIVDRSVSYSIKNNKDGWYLLGEGDGYSLSTTPSTEGFSFSANMLCEILDNMFVNNINDSSIYGSIAASTGELGASTAFIVAPTAYSTVWGLNVKEYDALDTLYFTIKMQNQDTKEIYTIEANSPASSETMRKMTFLTNYIDSSGGAHENLPDGVYDVTASVTENKLGYDIEGVQDKLVGRIVIKRSKPPEPVISVNGGEAAINYPADSAIASSLRATWLQSEYQKAYRFNSDSTGISAWNAYSDVLTLRTTGLLTARHIDFAGNYSEATARIRNSSNTDISEGGLMVFAQENRSADVYFIGIRRSSNGGVDASCLDFVN
ncbi:MAG: hypothetical protein PUF72_00035 [Clostridiales bacterium]|nr:hypothetical protein [Clostridiales bacterium]